MRSLSYFTYDPAKPDARDALEEAYQAYCISGGHIVNGSFSADVTLAERPQWDAMVKQIEDSNKLAAGALDLPALVPNCHVQEFIVGTLYA